LGDNPAITLCANEYEALMDADAMLLITEWRQFRYPDFSRMKSMMKQPVIYDGRNQYDPRQVRELGFSYYAIGRP
jgi:UDPglucose 6-dehydrogenase